MRSVWPQSKSAGADVTTEHHAAEQCSRIVVAKLCSLPKLLAVKYVMKVNINT